MNLWKVCRFLINRTMMNRLGLNLIDIINGIHRMVKGLRKKSGVTLELWALAAYKRYII